MSSSHEVAMERITELCAQAAIATTMAALTEVTKEILGEAPIREQLRAIMREWVTLTLQEVQTQLQEPTPKKKGK